MFYFQKKRFYKLQFLLITIGIIFGYFLQSFNNQNDNSKINFKRPFYISDELLPKKPLLISILRNKEDNTKKYRDNNLNYDLKYFNLNEYNVVKEIDKNYIKIYNWFFLIKESAFFFQFQVSYHKFYLEFFLAKLKIASW